MEAIDVARDNHYLFVVEEDVGIHIYYNDTPLVATYLSTVEIPQATRIELWGIYAFVSAMEGGLVIINIADYSAPFIAGQVDGIVAADVHLFSHYQIGSDFAVRAYVADPTYGVHIIDLLPEIESPEIVGCIDELNAHGVDVYTRWVVATETEPSREHDYLYIAAGNDGLIVYDITNPDGVYFVSAIEQTGNIVDLEIVSQLAPPGVDDYAVLANETYGLQMVDVTDPLNPISIGIVPDAQGILRVFVEVQQMDRFLSEQGDTLKENSHPFTETLNREDIVRILSASITCDEFDPCPSDVNGDNEVNVGDLLAIIDAWGCTDCFFADVNGDGIVNVSDLLMVVGNWGECE
jgi:hypothetical protein